MVKNRRIEDSKNLDEELRSGWILNGKSRSEYTIVKFKYNCNG